MGEEKLLSCFTCGYFKGSEIVGVCRKRAPERNDKGKAVFPEVLAEFEWCGDYENKKSFREVA